MVIRGWTLWSKFVLYSRLSSEHNWVDLYDHCRTKRIFILEMNKIIHMSSKRHEENGESLTSDLLIVFRLAHRVIRILGEVGAELKAAILGQLTLCPLPT